MKKKECKLEYLWLAGLLLSGTLIAQPGDDGSTPESDIEESQADAIESVEPNVVTFPESEPGDDSSNQGSNQFVATTDELVIADPLMPFNRAMHKFNDVTYRYVLIPLVDTYVSVTPDPVEKGIGNFFDNIKTPVYLINHLLRGDLKGAGRDIGRFAINTTLGVAGFGDPATNWFDIEEDLARAGDTMAGYGVGYGFYLVLPFIGPSNARSGVGMFIDGQLNPIQYLMDSPENTGVRIFDNFQEYGPTITSYTDLREESEDLYLFMRNLHVQGLLRDQQYPEQPSEATTEGAANVEQ